MKGVLSLIAIVVSVAGIVKSSMDHNVMSIAGWICCLVLAIILLGESIAEYIYGNMSDDDKDDNDQPMPV